MMCLSDSITITKVLFSFSAHGWSLKVRKTKLNDMFFLIFYLLV